MCGRQTNWSPNLGGQQAGLPCHHFYVQFVGLAPTLLAQGLHFAVHVVWAHSPQVLLLLFAPSVRQVPTSLAQGVLWNVYSVTQAATLQALGRATAHLAHLGVTPLLLGHLHRAPALCVLLAASLQALEQLLPVDYVEQAATSLALV